jgi:hypothetical protein
MKTTHPTRLFATVAALAIGLAVTLPTTAAAADAPPDLSGSWGQKMVQTAVTQLPLIGETVSQTKSWMLVDVEQEGREVTWSTEVCQAQVDGDVDAVQTILPEGFADAIPNPERTGELTRTDDGEWRLEIDRETMVMGARLRNPESENLPDSPDAPTVVDADDDGHPGVTIRMEGMLGGRLSIVQRARDSYLGTEVTDQRIRGTVDWMTEREIIESSNPLLGSDLATDPHPEAARSYFEMKRIDADASCKDLMEQRGELFE